MGGNPGEEPRRGVARRALERVRSWLLSSPAHVGYAVVVAALLLTIPFGGLRAAPEEALPEGVAGTPIDAAPWEITLEEVLWGPDLGGVLLDTGTGRDHVLITATVRNTSDQTLSTEDLRTSLRVLAPDDLADASGTALAGGALPTVSVYDLRPTPQLLRGLVPGLSYPVGIALTSDGERPEAVRLEVLAKTYRQSSLDDSMLWTDAAPVAEVDVPTTASGPVFVSSWDLVP